MTDDERRILQAWAEGEGTGLSLRHRRRAWAVLADERREPPHAIAEAFGCAAAAHRWISAFHRSGLIGLLDKPRRGRPHEASALLDEAKEAVIQAVSDESDGGRLTEAFTQMTKAEREKLWRFNRRYGWTNARARRSADLAVRLRPTLNHLLVAYGNADLAVVAWCETPARHFEEAIGRWLDVPTTHRDAFGTVLKERELGMVVQALCGAAAGRVSAAASRQLRLRVVDWLSYYAQELPGEVHVLMRTQAPAGAVVDFLQAISDASIAPAAGAGRLSSLTVHWRATCSPVDWPASAAALDLPSRRAMSELISSLEEMNSLGHLGWVRARQ